MNGRQSNPIVALVLATFFAFILAGTTTSVPIRPGYVIACVIVAALFVVGMLVAVPRLPNALWGIALMSFFLGPTLLGLMHHYYPTTLFPSIAWWHAMAVFWLALILVLSVRFTLLLIRRRNQHDVVT